MQVVPIPRFARRGIAGLCALLCAVVPLGSSLEVAYGQTDMAAATADATKFAKDERAASVSVPDQQATADVVPGANSAPSDLKSLYQSNDTALKNAGDGATTTEAFTSLQSADANRNTVDLAPIKAMRDDAQQIIDAAPAALDPSLQPTGTQGQCKEVQSTPITQTYDATCETGTQVITSQPAMVYSCLSDFVLAGKICTKTLTQSPTVSYSCPNGGTLNGAHCVTTQPATISGYSCPIGFTLNGTSCERTLQQAPSVNSYTCPSGFTLNGTTCSQTIQQPASPSYSCSNGYTLAGSTCTTGSSYPAVSTYSCPTGFTLAGSTCTQVTSQPATATNSCSGTDILSGSVCLHGSSYFPNIIYICPINWVPYGINQCRGGTHIIGATVSYQCNGTDTLISGPGLSPSCITVVTLTPNTTYSCPNGGTLAGTLCQTVVTQPASGSLSCPSGGTLSGSTCDSTVTQPASVTYSCPAGYTTVGSLCEQTTSVAASPVLSCPAGYSVNGLLCELHEVQPATPALVCPNGFSLSGSDCLQMVDAAATMSCPSGYTLNGPACSQTITQPAAGALLCSDGSPPVAGICQILKPGQTDCAALSGNPQCVFDHDNCLDDPQVGACQVKESVYKCPVPGTSAPATKQYLCSGDVYCMNGDCETVDRDTSDDFKDAMVALNAMNQVGKEFDPKNFTVFKGERDTCHKSVFGIVNCCAGKSSGMLFGANEKAAKAAIAANQDYTKFASHSLFAFLCSKDEKNLDVKDRLGLCHSVGSYCSSSVLGVCITKKKAYCCYQSKLSRILQEQGRPQINKPWGSAKKEQCPGFTIDEFSHLDLSKMDFSEVYAEFVDAAKLPDSVQMSTDIQAKIKAYYQQNGQPNP